MAEARQRDDWWRWSELLALTYNAHRGPKSPAMRPGEWNPMAEADVKTDLHALGRTLAELGVPWRARRASRAMARCGSGDRRV